MCRGYMLTFPRLRRYRITECFRADVFGMCCRILACWNLEIKATFAKMKKIHFVSNEGSYTGAPVFLVKLVKHLREKTNYRLLVLFARPGPLTQVLAQDDVEVIVSEKSRRNIAIPTKLYRRATHYLRYIRLLLLDRPDLVYSNTIANFGEVVLAGCLRIPVILHMHEGQHVAHKHRLRLRLACCFSAKIIVGSQYVNRVLLAVTKRTGQVIYNGVLPTNNGGKKKIKSEKPVLLGIVGTINPNKGQHVAIEAMRILIDRGVGVQLIIAGVSGDDAYFEKIREQVNQASLIGFVKFIGAVPDSVEFIDTLDLLLVPSFDEALPTVILEAFSLGVPVVASNVGGIPEMIEDGSSGFLFQAGDAEKLASCLAGVICDKRLLENIAKAANEVVRNKFNLNVSNAQIEYCINETLSQ